MKQKKHTRYETARKVLIFWCFFIGIGAVAGSAAMLAAPDGSILGMQELLPCFQVLPLSRYLYQDFLFPGIALLAVNGIPNLTAAVLLLRHRESGMVCGGIFGVTLMLWITIQFVIFPMNVMSTSYFIFGMLQALTGYMAWVFCRQEQFEIRPGDYPHIGTNPRRLVVYFSRMGYTRREALAEANRTGAVLYELQASEQTEGTMGFWWCGRFGMHRWDMRIQPVQMNLSDFEHVTVCTPIWVFHTAGPVRSFCRQASGQIRKADYIIVHYNRMDYPGAAREMDQLLGLSSSPVTSVCCRQGRVKYKKHTAIAASPE